jgi:FimV-like protein
MEMLKRALAGSPHRHDLTFMLAQIYLRKQDFKAARQLIDKVMENGDADLRRRAQRLLAQLVSLEAHLARIEKLKEEEASYTRTGTAPGDSSETTVMTTIEHPFDPSAALRDSLRRPVTGETHTQGTLSRIDCDAKGITFVVKVGNRLLKLNTDTFRHANIMSFSEDAGQEITCGIRKTQNNVVVAYVALNDPRAKVDGALKSLEFVPPDFKLKP